MNITNMHIYLSLPMPIVHAQPQPGIDLPGRFTLTVNGHLIPTISNFDYDYAHFSSPAGLRLEISHPTASLVSARISPQRLGIAATVAQGKVTAELLGPGYYIVKLDSYPELVLLVDEAEAEAEEDVPAADGTGVWNVVAAGAQANNTDLTSTTAIFQECLDAASAWGTATSPGVVYVPAGVYAIGNLILNSNTTLYLASQSMLRFRPDEKAAYKHHWFKNSQGNRPITWWLSTAFNSSHISILGRGTLDGNGPSSAAANIGNNLLVPIATSHFTTSGLILRNSASWSCTPILATHASFTATKFLNRFTDAGENDGIDVMHSQHVTVTTSIGIGLDDPFSTKTWSAETSDIAMPWPILPAGLPPTSDVAFADTLSWTICFGLKVGAGVWAPHKNISFERAVVYDCSIGVGIHFQAGESYVQGVRFRDIEIENSSWTNLNTSTWCALMVTGGTRSGEEAPPPVSDVVVEGVVVRRRGNTDARLEGRNDTEPLNDISFVDVMMPEGPAASLLDMGFGDIRFVENVTVELGSP